MRSIGNRRGLWVFLFLLFGLPAMFSVMVLPFNPLLALPWVVVTGTVAVVSGYRIWRIDHPYESAERRLTSWPWPDAGETGMPFKPWFRNFNGPALLFV